MSNENQYQSFQNISALAFTESIDSGSILKAFLDFGPNLTPPPIIKRCQIAVPRLFRSLPFLDLPPYQGKFHTRGALLLRCLGYALRGGSLR